MYVRTYAHKVQSLQSLHARDLRKKRGTKKAMGNWTSIHRKIEQYNFSMHPCLLLKTLAEVQAGQTRLNSFLNEYET
jgi:hypothetical protein